jgi:hypothetical protein
MKTSERPKKEEKTMHGSQAYEIETQGFDQIVYFGRL